MVTVQRAFRTESDPEMVGDGRRESVRAEAAMVGTLVCAPRVLVVDDDPVTATVVRAVLGIGVTVVGLPDVYQALDHIEQQRVDLLLLELFLPGASGADLLRRLAVGPRPSRVIALTHACSVTRLAPDVVVDGILHKPPAPGAILAELEAAIAARRGASAAGGPWS